MSPDVGQRREHRRPRPHHHVEPPSPRSRATSGTARACPHRRASPPVPRTPPRSPPPSPAPAPPPAPTRSPAAPRRDTRRTASTATATSSSGAGRTTNVPPPSRARQRAQSRSDTTRRALRTGRVRRRRRPRGAGHGMAGQAERGRRHPAARQPPRSLFGRDPRRHRPPDHRSQRRDVSLAHPPQQLQHALIEEPHGRHELLHAEHPRPERLRGSHHPSADQPSVERHLHERPHPGVELGREQVRERPIEAEDGAVDADRDRTLQQVRGRVGRGQRGRGSASRRRGGGRRRGRSPPRGTLCARSARTRPSRDRWDGRAADRG